jgi:hypothetical protein
MKKYVIARPDTCSLKNYSPPSARRGEGRYDF